MKAAWDGLKGTARFAAYALRRFGRDQCLGTAAALTFTSLLALVPIMAIGFSILAAFSVFDQIRVDIQIFLFESFMPDVGVQLDQYFATFLENTGNLTAVGLLALGLTALMLLGTIETALNAIWRVRRPRPWRARLLVYWMLLTLAPLLFGASLSLSGYLMAVVRMAGGEGATVHLARLAEAVPLALGAFAFALAYMILPHRRVRVAHAVVGGLTASVLFEVLKRLFAFYVVQLPTYQTIYGALSAFPIFLVWLYVSWGVVLFGAVVAASLGEWRKALDERAKGVEVTTPSHRLEVALAVVSQLFEASRDGATLRPEQMLASVECSPATLDRVLDDLHRAGFAIRAERDRWALLRDPDAATLYDLYRALGLGMAETTREGTAGECLYAVAEAERELMSRGLREILTGAADRRENALPLHPKIVEGGASGS